jgi:cytochrome c5
VEPGDVAEVSVALDTTGKFGQVQKTVTIKTNDPVEPELDVPVSVFVEHSSQADTDEPLESVLFGEECGRCHAQPAAGLQGAAIYDAICQMCHGSLSEYVGSLPSEVLERATLRAWIAEGRAEVGMPGYDASVGGPLTPEQIDSLVDGMLGADEAATGQ